MELPVISALEFEQVKSSIKNFIKNQTDFTVYDFEGSNLSMLIDVLAYNTLYSSYNVNMAANELNLDTAVLRDNVVSIAKRLGYTANSYTSARVTTNVILSNVGAYDYVRLKKGKVLAASVNGKTQTFIVRDDVELNVKGKTTATIENVNLEEGTEFTIFYTVDSSNEHQRFFIPNNYVDAETVKAYVITDPTNTLEREYERKKTIVNVGNSDEVFFVEEVQDQKYEVIFGDDVIGRKLRDGEVVKIEYVVNSGSDGNNIKKSGFKFAGTVVGLTETGSTPLNYSNISWNLVTERSDGGSDYETIKSIKYRAPRQYASQERAVTLSDYEAIIQKLYPNTDLVRVVGGESMTPPQFGKVFITIKPIVGESVSFSEKQRIIRELNDFKVGSVEVELNDPVGIKIVARPTIVFDPSKTKNTRSELISLINAKIQEYISGISFNNFGGEYSDLTLRCSLKGLDGAISFVTVPIYLSQLVGLDEGIEKLYEVNFYTQLNDNTLGQYYVLSDPFCHKNISEPVHIAALAGCNGSDKLFLITSNGTLIKEIGTVDIATGRLEFTIEPCQDEPINILVVPEVLDIIFGPEVIPSFEIDQIIIIDDVLDLDDRGPTLGLDNPVLPGPDDLTGGTGDPGTPTTVQIIDTPGGGTPLTPLVPPSDTDPDAPTDDPNNIIDIENFTPETNPYSCS